MSLVEDQRLVVKAINVIRKEAGLGRIHKLRRGIPLHMRACTLAMSLEGTGLTGGQAIMILGERMKDNGIAAYRIAHAFDQGELPELEIPRSIIKIKYPGDRKATIVG